MDFGSTIHHVQGSTEDSLLASLKGSSYTYGPKDAEDAYVAMSRTRTAETCKLLDSIGAGMLQQGPLVGPHCLLNKLRCIWDMAACATFFESSADQKKMLEPKHQQFVCFGCTLNEKTEISRGWQCFTVNKKTTLHDVQAQGSWRRCQVCMEYAATTQNKGKSGAKGADHGLIGGLLGGEEGAGMGVLGTQFGAEGKQFGVRGKGSWNKKGAAFGSKGAESGEEGAGMGVLGTQFGVRGKGFGSKGAESGTQGAAFGSKGKGIWNKKGAVFGSKGGRPPLIAKVRQHDSAT